MQDELRVTGWWVFAQLLARADRSWLDRLITRRVPPEQFQQALRREADDIKVTMQFAKA
jgi:hypothetical protein